MVWDRGAWPAPGKVASKRWGRRDAAMRLAKYPISPAIHSEFSLCDPIDVAGATGQFPLDAWRARRPLRAVDGEDRLRAHDAYRTAFAAPEPPGAVYAAAAADG